MITVVFQVKNEASMIVEAIKSALPLTQNIIVMDMQSQDETAKLAREAGAQVMEIPSAPYVEPVRSLAFTKTKTDWILLLDADERLTKELIHEIKETLSKKSDVTHYSLPRRNIFTGKVWLKHGGWWPDKQIRLIKREAFIHWPTEIHSTVKVEGKVGFLKHPFLHYFHGNLAEMVKKTLKFENQEAELLFKAGRAVSTLTFFRKYLGEFFRRLVKKQGFRDGAYGIIESIYQAYSKTITWLMVYEKKL